MSYRWILVLTVLVAVLLVLFQPPRVAEAQGGPGGAGTIPSGTSTHPCLKGEGVGTPVGDYGTCTKCNPFTGKDEPVQEAQLNCVNCTVAVHVDAALAGTLESIDGSSVMPGGGGPVDAHGGSFTCTMPLDPSTDGGFT